MFLQDGIIPAWEDEANKSGGKWSIQLPKDKNRLNVDRMWLYTVSQTYTSLFYHSVFNIDVGRHRRNLRSLLDYFGP